ncbi:hypothetical protein Hanom_Chr16g01501741 [Helianthus anomalus]
MSLHRAIGVCNIASLLRRKMIGWSMRSEVKVDESVTDRVLERMVNRTTSFVPNGALVKCDGIGCIGGVWEETTEG